MRKLLGTTWVEIDLDAIKYNIQNIKKLVGKKTKIMGIVKGNGYGHDAIEISKTILKYGVDQLAVARIEEAIILRKNNIEVPILVLGVSPKEQMELYLEYQIMATISDLDYLYQFNDLADKLNRKIKVHLKIETGMCRLGLNSSDVNILFSQTEKISNVEIEGVFTHFSTADESDKGFTYKQFDQFMNTIDLFRNLKIVNRPIFHAANSGAILDLPKTWLDMVRPGCIIYGLYPSDDVKRIIDLQPALSFKSRVCVIKKVVKGSFVGYGRAYQAKKDIIIAIIPVGYADGYPRLLSNIGNVLIRGELAPVVGRVCMDQVAIDISSIKGVTIDDEVVIWGSQSQGKKNIPVKDIAQKLNTITDEILHITDKARVAKLFIKNGKPWKVKNILSEHTCDGKN